MIGNLENILSIATFVTFLLFLVLAIFLVTKNIRSSTNISFSLVCVSASIWSLNYSIAYRSVDTDVALFWFKIGYVGVMFIAITYFHFAIVFLRLKNMFKYVSLNYIAGIFLTGLLLNSNMLISGLNVFSWGRYPKAGSLHPIFLLYFFALVNIATIQLAVAFIKKRKTIPLTQVQQLKYILFAFSIYTINSIDFIPNYGISILPVGFIPATIFMSIIVYSIVKFRLMDISVAITRTSIFVAVYSLVLGIPFALAFGWRARLQNILGEGWWLAPLVSSTVLATAGPFIYLYIQKRAENRLFQEQKRYQSTLRQASAGMGRIKDLNRLVNLIVHIVSRTVRLEHALVYLQDPQTRTYVLKAHRSRAVRFKTQDVIESNSEIVKVLNREREPVVYEEIKQQTQDYGDLKLARLETELAAINAALVVPCYIDEKLLAMIILGRKMSNDLYSESDLAVFSILANQAALAMENAMFYEEMKNTHAQLMKAEKMATIGTMADGLSHQINNRLHALGFIAGDALDTIKYKKDVLMKDPEVKEIMVDLEHALNRIEDNVTQGGEIVRGLLKYTRKGEEGFSDLEFDQLINASVEMTQFKIKPGELQILREYGADIPKIKGNFTQLQEVFFNLIDNAYDAMMQRKAELKEKEYSPTIKIFAQGDNNGGINIRFEDNGIGIKDEDKMKLFTPFFTTKLSSKKGTGLGLYVIQKLIEENHEGKVAYSSVYQQGTNVSIYLHSV